ncbi:MAG: Mur ligase family protein [Patescibacteria group bacterium]
MTKTLLKHILKYYLKVITKLVLFIKRPTIIGIAGNTNKTFTKNYIARELKQAGLSIRVNPNNFNTEIGLPLAILYLPSGYNYYKKWIPAILKAPMVIFKKDFPDYLVLELGTSDTGDMKYLLSLIKPTISVITDVTQRYLEGYSDMDEMMEEYRLLVKKTDRRGLVILNRDNPRIKRLRKCGKARVIFFGLGEKADIQAKKTGKGERGEIITVVFDQEEKEYHLDRFGDHHIYAFLISLAVKNNLLYGAKKKKG